MNFRTWRVLFVVVMFCIGTFANATEYWFLYIGTYTSGTSEGIYQLRLNKDTGVFEYLGLAAQIKNPSFLTLHPDRPLLYAVGEGIAPSDKSEGLASAFSINSENGRLTLLNQQPTIGEGPCHVAVDRQGLHIVTANYGDGSITVLPITGDGRLEPATDLKRHSGSSVHPSRQTAPHAHSVTFDATGHLIYATDLGLDKIMVYQYDSHHGKLQPHIPPFVAVAPGAGPRHFAFHPSGRFAYGINELNSTVTSFISTGSTGELAILQTIGTLPEAFDGETYPAEIRVHPSGRFVYASNRGHDSIALFKVEEQSGQLTALGHISTLGKVPRNFAISPDGKYLVVANQETENVVVFKINVTDGTLIPIASPANVPSPVCVLFYALKDTNSR